MTQWTRLTNFETKYTILLASKVFGVGIFSTAILTLLTPLAANGGVYVLMAVRIIEGIFEGVTFPCVNLFKHVSII